MPLKTLARRLKELEERTHQPPPHPVLEKLRENPACLLTLAGLQPDAWQENLLRSQAARMLLLCSRQAGKSTVAAALALAVALLKSKALVLLLSPSQRQSGELFRKVVDLFNRSGRPMGIVAETTLKLELANGSRVVSLPGTEETIRGYSDVAMLVIDEAARVDDPLYCAVRPMLAVSQGRLVALSTPFGKRGWFHDEWFGTGEWERVQVTALQCPRISPDFLAEEKRSLGDRWYRQEYMTSFEDALDAVFSYEDIMAAMSPDLKPLI